MLIERLVRLNGRFDSQGSRVGLSLLVFVLSLATYLVHTHLRHSLTGPPSVTGDSVEYDSLAWELAHGRGYRIDLSNPDFRAPYLNDQESASTAANWPREPYGPTARRPPLYAVLLAGGDLVAGRQFWFSRVVNILCLSATCALVSWTVARIAGPLPGLFAAFQFVVVDWRTRFYAREMLTEAVSALLVAVLAVLLIQMDRKHRLGQAVIAGCVFGLALLTRGVFVLWAPGLLLLLFRSYDPRALIRANRSALIAAGAFILFASLVASPWWVRNCRLLGRFAPFGTQGEMELVAGYSDAAFRGGGMWSNLLAEGVFDSVLETDFSGLEQEQAIADESSRLAVDWVADNIHKLPLLAAGKVFHELRPHGAGDLYVLSFALLGLLAIRGSPEFRVLGGMILTCLFAVALTWSASGRFMLPVLYPLHVAAGTGIWIALLGVTLDQKRARSRLRLDRNGNDEPRSDCGA